MRTLIFALLLSLVIPLSQQELSEAERLYQAGQYQGSVRAYLLSLHQHPEQRDNIRFNLAQAYLRMDSLNQALLLFEQVISPDDPHLASLAANNAAVVRLRQGRYPEALEGFRRSLVFDDQNEIARYNFELLSKRMQPPPQDPFPPEAEPPSDLPPAPEIDEETYRNIIQQLQKRSLSGLNDRGRPVGNDTITVQEAERLLEALDQQDLQFIQQLRKIMLSSPRPQGKQEW
jgi:tetratricopeptide (TPR) repeat protein